MRKGLKMFQQCRSQEEARFFADSCRMRNGKPMSVLVTTCAGAVSESFSLPRRDVMGFPALHKDKLLMIRSRQNTLAGRHACLLNCNWLKGSKIINSLIRYTVILPGNNNCASVGVFLLRAFPLEKAAALKWRLVGWRNPGGGVGGWGWELSFIFTAFLDTSGAVIQVASVEALWSTHTFFLNSEYQQTLADFDTAT